MLRRLSRALFCDADAGLISECSRLLFPTKVLGLVFQLRVTSRARAKAQKGRKRQRGQGRKGRKHRGERKREEKK
eukprot:13493688-Alexandrium_andersonii.AAC.1